MNALLAPYAVPYEGILGRGVKEADDETRFPFQRDRDRIIHTQAFRRLQGKTQVFVTGEGDHYRTRLTHTMEVAQISRDMARTLQLNEDLAECIALAHDVGHPPFGHTGEAAIDAWMQQFDKRFEHNRQSLRIVTQLEHHSSMYAGLNLNQEILQGLQKHQTSFDQTGATHEGHSLEAQLVNVADEIAYTAHDSDDGLQVGLFTLEEIQEVPLVKHAVELSKERGTSLRGALIHLLVHNVYQASQATLENNAIHTLDAVYTYDGSLITFDNDMIMHLSTLRDFLWQKMYMHPSVVQKSREGSELLTRILDALYKQPNQKITTEIDKNSTALEEAVKDYTAGMTERFAYQFVDSI